METSSSVTPERKPKKSYVCDECEYVANILYNLKVHKSSQHEGLRHPCTNCDFTATQRSHLNAHMRKKHSDIQQIADPEPFLVNYES